MLSYVAELRALADHCNFGGTLNAMIRDRLVCGINEDNIQKCLLTEGDPLTLVKAMSIAQSYETAEKDATELLPTETVPQPVHRVQPAAAQTHHKKCYRCGRPGHLPSTCRFKKERCHNCNKIGHIKRACTVNPKNTPVRNVQLVSQMDSIVEHEYPLFTLTASHTSPIMISIKINDKQVPMELDTGDAVSLVSEDTYKLHWSEHQLQESTARLKTYSGEHLEVLGSVDAEVEYGEQQVTLPLLVVKGGGPSLFG